MQNEDAMYLVIEQGFQFAMLMGPHRQLAGGVYESWWDTIANNEASRDGNNREIAVKTAC